MSSALLCRWSCPPATPKGFFTVENLKWLIEKLTLPLVLAAITIFFQWNANQRSRDEIDAADQRAKTESRTRLYTELLHKREDADTAVRRAVFDKLMDRYLSPAPKDLDDKLVALELLAVNFHDSLNLSPLFWQIDRQITSLGNRADPLLREHLTRVSQGVKDRQMAFLAPEDFAKPLPVELAAVPSIALPTEGCVAIEALAQAGQGASTLRVNASYADSDAQGATVLHQRRFSVALDCKDLFGKLLATGITAIVVGQACINVGAALGLLPLTGVPLPLVSVGGTSMLVVLAGLGILLNIATNRRSHIAVSAQRRDGLAGSGGDRRSPAAGTRRRG